MLPKKIIAGMSVRDYAYLWIEGHCLLHQWCSGARAIDADVVGYAEKQLREITAAVATDEGRERTGWGDDDAKQFGELVDYLRANAGAPAEPYVPDQFTRGGPAREPDVTLSDFERAYCVAALWASTDNNSSDDAREGRGEPLDSTYGVGDIHPDTLALMVADCQRFQREHAALLAEAYENYPNRGDGSTPAEYAGHDFWLTRNRHGAGFWDRDLGDVGRKLTDAAHAFGEFNIDVSMPDDRGYDPEHRIVKL